MLNNPRLKIKKADKACQCRRTESRYRQMNRVETFDNSNTVPALRDFQRVAGY